MVSCDPLSLRCFGSRGEAFVGFKNSQMFWGSGGEVAPETRRRYSSFKVKVRRFIVAPDQPLFFPVQNTARTL